MSRPPSLHDFFTENFVDVRGRVPAVLGRDAADPVTPDRTLRDAALAVLVLAKAEEPELTRTLLTALREFDDAQAAGFHELLDVTGTVHPVGDVRTPATQALAWWALHHAGTALDDPATAAEARAGLRPLAESVLAGGWPARLHRDGATVLDGASLLEQVAVLVLAAHAVDDGDAFWASFLTAAAEQLAAFDSADGAWAALTARGEPDAFHGYRLRSSALAVLAWSALHERATAAGSPDLGALEHARKVLRHLDTHEHTRGRGLWDRVSADSQTRVDPLLAQYGRPDSPFPAKLMPDHALAVLAADRVAELSDDVWAKELSALAAAELWRYTDTAVGGIFQGQGSWFSTPVDATVPLARHVMVPPRSAGAFSVGNTAYVPFHEKHATTQLLALAALGDREQPAPTVPGPAPELKPWPLERDLSYVSREPLSEGLIDLPAYLAWLRSTASGLGYGLTPYRAPLGLRSDRTAQTFSVLHVVSDLMALNEPIANRDQLLAGIYATQNPDGGFGEQPSLLSEAFTTYCAVLTATVLGGTDYDTDQCAAFLQACQHAEGAFGNAPGYPGDAWHCNLAVLALLALGRRPEREADLVAYFAACRNQDGGYGNQPGHPSDTFATFRVVDTLIALGLEPPRHEETIAWLRGLQTEAGGFRYRPSGPESFVGSYHAIASLYVLGSEPADPAACRAWIAARQSSDGGFGRVPGGASETTDEGFIAIQALHMLEGKLNPYWAVIMT
ncbi:prenyltransferase/squalene oxidase repeat-containing protein [Kitasatospora sp. NPDC101176]|uniref:prenyltransferase/squalene oxidase repeat-containing protein n=1 Tax=Kitasatospora sp. NPDC101176 TaxID=3364099 RepID=UPI003818BFE4